jgi:hypothetical protein
MGLLRASILLIRHRPGGLRSLAAANLIIVDAEYFEVSELHIYLEFTAQALSSFCGSQFDS